jgi:ABC-type bacteriocin/lantibiotic exporter with double-glycine peptidase domain
MRIRLPLVKQKGRPVCGPASLKMVLSYFGNKLSLKDLEKETNYKEGKGTSPIKLALVARKLSYDILVLTTSIIPKKRNPRDGFF